MASISYDEIFSAFLGSVTDYDLQVNLSPSDSFALMSEYLHKSLSDPYVKHIFTTATLDDETQIFTYELDREEDKDFVINALAKWMVYEWLHKEVRSRVNTAQFIGTKEQKYYSQAQHISELRALQDDALREARFYIQNKGFISNSYLQEG